MKTVWLVVDLYPREVNISDSFIKWQTKYSFQVIVSTKVQIRLCKTINFYSFSSLDLIDDVFSESSNKKKKPSFSIKVPITRFE